MATNSASPYVLPRQWIRYDGSAILDLLVAAKAAATVLRRMPYLPQWISDVHEEQLRLEAEGTSRIEGAEFDEAEKEQAIAPDAIMSELTRSQRQLRSAESVYRWLGSLSPDRLVNEKFILDVHRRIVTGCDDDHSEPGALRPAGWNVTFGMPKCRGAAGGDECLAAFRALCREIGGRQFRAHDPIIQAIAVHYHIGAMHPFGDGNGRTARALEAFMLRSAVVNDLVMVGLSNYYYDHKDEYLSALSQSRQEGHDLTPFLCFGLEAIKTRCDAVAETIAINHKRVLYREFARSLFGKLASPRRRVLAERQLQILDVLLDVGPMSPRRSLGEIFVYYNKLKHPFRAMNRDMARLLGIRAIVFDGEQLSANLDWPQRSSESQLLNHYENMPSAASADHPAMAELSRLLGRGGRFSD